MPTPREQMEREGRISVAISIPAKLRKGETLKTITCGRIEELILSALQNGRTGEAYYKALPGNATCLTNRTAEDYA